MKSITLDELEVKERLGELIDLLGDGTLDEVFISQDGVVKVVMIRYQDYQELVDKHP